MLPLDLLLFKGVLDFILSIFLLLVTNGGLLVYRVGSAKKCSKAAINQIVQESSCHI